MTDERAVDAGVTLIELVIAIAVGSIIIGGITAALLAAVLNYTSSATRLAESHDAQLLASWFLPDAQSAGATVDTTGVTASGCSGAAVSGSSNVIAMTWSDYDGSATYAAAYRLEPNTDGTATLVRYFCTPAGSTPSRVVVGHSVASASASTTPQTITLRVTSCATAFGPPASATTTLTTTSSCYSYALSGTRLISVATPSTVPPTTSTSVPPTSTTSTSTTSTSTTSTTLSCQLTSISATPASVALQGGSGHLQNDVTLVVGTTGSCSGISATFNPGSGSQTVPLSRAGSTWSATVAKNDYSWTKGSHPITVSGGTPQTGVADPVPFTVT